jgi:RNA polymerase sigma factor (sigma-70 family)
VGSSFLDFVPNAAASVELQLQMLSSDSQLPHDGAQPGHLIEELAWLQTLAHRLVRDRAIADDAVQETWLAALKRFGRDAVPPRDWLLSKLRSSVWNQKRAGQRRDRREQVSARLHEAQPSTSDLVLQSEAQQLLLTALLNLPDDLRDVLLMRHSAGLSVTEIAKRQNCAKSTISARVERGRRLLRDRLGSSQQGPAWGACVLLAEMPNPTTLAPFPPSFWSSLLLSQNLKLASVALSVLVVCGLTLSGFGIFSGRALETAPETGTDLASPRLGSMRAFDHGAPASEVAGTGRIDAIPEVQASIASAEDYVLKGTVTRLDGRPFTGARISLLEEEKEHKHVLTGSAGQFELRLSPSELDGIATATMLRARIVAKGHYERREFEFSDTKDASFPLPRRSSSDQIGVVQLPGAGGIAGRVLDKDGAPVSEAEVSLNVTDPDQSDGVATYYGPTGFVEAKTDVDGRFRLEGITPGSYLVEASHPQFEEMTIYVLAQCALGHITSDVTLELQRAEILTGRFQDTHGLSIANAYVSSRSFSRGSTVQTDANGHFSLPLRRGSPAELKVHALGYELVSPKLDRDFTPADSGMIIVMRSWEPSTVFQLVSSRGGEVITMAACSIIKDAADQNLAYFRNRNLGAARVREGGLVRSQAINGQDVLLVEAPGYEQHAVRVKHDSIQAPHQQIELHPTRGGLRGRVWRGTDTIPGARILLQGANFRLNEPRFVWSDNRLSAADGERLNPRTLGYSSYELKGVVGLDGPPPSHRFLPLNSTQAATRSDCDGYFELSAAPLGPSTLSLNDDHGTHATFAFSGVRSDAGQDLGDLYVPWTASLSGRLDLGDTSAQVRLQVSIESLDRAVEVTETGTFSFEGLPPGDLYLDVDELVRQDVLYLVHEPSFHLRLDPGERREVILPVHPWLACQLDSSVTINGLPAPEGCSLLVRPVGSDLPFKPWSAITNEDGQIRDHLPSLGLCEVELRVPSAHSWPTVLRAEDLLLDLRPGVVVQQELPFSSCQLSATVHVAGEPGASIYLDLVLVRTDGTQASDTIRHIQFEPSAEDPERWNSARLQVSPGHYAAMLVPHQKPPINDSTQEPPLAHADLQLQPGAQCAATFN